MTVEFVLLVLSLLFFASIITDKIGNKFGVPALLLFLAVGMLFGSDCLGSFMGTDGFDGILDIDAAQAFGTVALCIILFSGGLDTKLSDIQPVMAPGVTLATIGVLLTAAISGFIIFYVFSWVKAIATVSMATAMLIASTMSSTDSASVFSILRTNDVRFKHNLRPLLELESGANDPMAYILTITLISIVTGVNKDVSALTITQNILIQLVMGGVMGLAFGKVVVWLLRKVQLTNESLYPIMVLTACIFIFAMTYYLKGNPYLAVYIGGLIIGNSKFTRKRQTKSFFDGLTWLSQLVMFLMLGLLVKPHELIRLEVWLPCLIISIVMIFIARPLSVFLCMIPFKQYKTQDKLLVSWVGLKGAVPIIFAILCEASGVAHANLIFNVVFACTLVSLVAQGTTLGRVAHKLRLAEPAEKEHKLVHFDIDFPEEVEASTHETLVTEDIIKNGNTLKDLAIPKKTLVIMVRRGDSYFVPTGQTELQLGDYLLVISDQDSQKVIQDMEDEEDWIKNEWSARLVTDTVGLVKEKWQQLIDNGKANHKKD